MTPGPGFWHVEQAIAPAGQRPAFVMFCLLCATITVGSALFVLLVATGRSQYPLGFAAWSQFVLVLAFAALGLLAPFDEERGLDASTRCFALRPLDRHFEKVDAN